MNSAKQSFCPQCGASLSRGKTCHQKFEEMLALEYESPTIFGIVHHITVICYNLQHPDDFTKEALAWMRSSLRSIIEEGLTPEKLRKMAGKEFKRRARVKHHSAEPQPRERAHWSMTVLDIRTDDPQKYVEDITAWAKSILEDLS